MIASRHLAALAAATLVATAAGRDAGARPPSYEPLSAAKPTLAEQVHAETVRAQVDNVRAAADASWGRRPASGGPARPTAPPSVPWCADATLADLQCQLVVRPLADAVLHGNRDASFPAALHRAIASGPPNHCMAWDDPLAARADAWSRYCNTGDDARKALVAFLRGDDAGASRKTAAEKAADAREEERLRRVARAFSDLAAEQERVQKAMEGRRADLLADCDHGSLAACRELEQVAFAPPAMPDEVWLHAQVQQCRLGGVDKCAPAADLLWEMRRWVEAMDLYEGACFNGHGPSCLAGTKWIEMFARIERGAERQADGERARAMLAAGCRGGDAASCDALQASIGEGLAGCDATPDERSALASACKAGVKAACPPKALAPLRLTQARKRYAVAAEDGTTAYDAAKAKLAPIRNDFDALEKACDAGNGDACGELVLWARRHGGERDFEAWLARCRVENRYCDYAFHIARDEHWTEHMMTILEGVCVDHPGWASLCLERAKRATGPTDALLWYDAACRRAENDEIRREACGQVYEAWARLECPAAKRRMAAFAKASMAVACTRGHYTLARESCEAFRKGR